MSNLKCQISNEKAFTLIELMVVIAIMAILTVAVFVNLRSFGEDANLKNTAFDLQSYLRLAQSNAASGVKCDTAGGVSWSVVITDRATIKLRCQTQASGDFVKTWSLHQPALIDAIDGLAGTTRCSSSFTSGGVINYPITITFSYLDGKVAFTDEDAANDCLTKNKNMVIKLIKKDGSSDARTVTVSKGGSINVESVD